MTTKQKIKAARRAAHYSTAQTAEALGISEYYYKLLETGRLDIPSHISVNMARLFGVSAADIWETGSDFLRIPVYLDKGAIVPTKSDNGACFELYSPKDVYINGGSSVSINTGVHIRLPNAYYAAVTSLPAMAQRYNVTADGVYCSGSRDSIRVQLFNHGSSGTMISAGEKIATLYILPCVLSDLAPAAGGE